MARSEAGDLFSEVAVEVLFLAGILTTAGDTLAAGAGQSTARWRVLAALEDQPRTVAGVAAALGLARQSVQRLANELCGDELTIAQPNPADRRADLIALTATGKRALTLIQKQQASWANRLGAKLGPRRLAAIRQALAELTHSLEEQP